MKEEEHPLPIPNPKNPSTYSTLQANPPLISGSLNETMCRTEEFKLTGQDAAMSAYGANFGSSALFVSYYAVSTLPKTTRNQREAIIQAEIQRSTANLPDVQFLSRKNLSTNSQTVMEMTCKSSRNKTLNIHARYICNDRQMLALTAVTPDGLSDKDAQSFDHLFQAFQFP